MRAALYGKIDETVSDLAIKCAGTPLTWTSLSVLFPYLTPSVGQRLPDCKYSFSILSARLLSLAPRSGRMMMSCDAFKNHCPRCGILSNCLTGIHCGIGSVAHHADAAQEVTSLATVIARMDPQTTLAGFSQESMLAQDKADDAHNRRIFEDNVELVVKAWTQESFTHKGPAWQVPFPYDEGIVDWPLAHAGVTQKLGAPGEVDDQGVWRRASVAPSPYTRPHPKVFVAGSGSPETSLVTCTAIPIWPASETSLPRATHP